MLSVLRDPGPMTQEGVGSGSLCIENDDATAERQAGDFATVGIEPRDITPWNAYPWYVNRSPSAHERDAGVEPLVRLIELLPRLRVVLLQGRDAQDTWRRLRRRHSRTAADLTVVETYHPSRQALWTPDPDIRQARVDNRTAAYRAVADVVCG